MLTVCKTNFDCSKLTNHPKSARIPLQKKSQILSEYKCFKTLQDSFSILKSIWKERKKESEKNVMKLIRLFSSNHWKENRKERNNLSEIIDLFICKSKYYEYI